jgi:hypothetical protein
MTITLNHTIVPAHDKRAAAQFFARIFGLHADPKSGHFAPVRINETLTLLFDDHEEFESHHYAFHVSDAEFDAILGRMRDGQRGAGNFVSTIPISSAAHRLLGSRYLKDCCHRETAA